MELSPGVKIAIGAKTYKGEIPDRILEGNAPLKKVVEAANAQSKEAAKAAKEQIAKDVKLESTRAKFKKKKAAERAALINPPKTEADAPAAKPDKK